MFAQAWEGVALDRVKNADPIQMPGEHLAERGQGFGQRRFIKEVLRRAETARAFQENVSFLEQRIHVPPEKLRGKKGRSVAEEL